MHNKKQNIPTDPIKLVKKVIKYSVMFFGLIFVIFGIIPFFIYFNVSNVSSAERSWLETEAEVTEAKIESQVSTISVYDHEEEENISKGTTNYFPEIVYKYTVDGKGYTGTKFRTLGYSSERRSEIEKMMPKLPVGGKIKIFYNPSDPGEATVEKAPAPSRIILVFGLIVIAVGLFIMFIVSRLSLIGVDLIMSTNPKLAK